VTSEDALLAVIDALESVGIPYMLVGGASVSYYGIGRSTKDADFVVELGAHSITSLTRLLGPPFRFDPQMSFETITGTYRHHIRLEDNPFQFEFFHLSRDPHDQDRFRRRRRVALMDRQVWLPSPEDVIITKLRWSLFGHRSKDRDDARDVIAVQGDRIDWDYVHSWCDQHGTRGLLDEIRQSIPPI
jgi:hypothetical protein